MPAPPPKAPPAASANVFKVLLKALAVLEELIARDGESGDPELARAVDLDKATVFRLLSTLVEAGYAERAAAFEGGRRRAGLK